jgi:hypothetical protein
MADRTQELTLLLRAQIKGQGMIDSFKGGLDEVAAKASRVGDALAGMGRATAVGLGMAAETLLTGGGVGQAAVQLGIHMASELTETFGEQAITKFTSSSLLAAVTAPMAAVGTAIGGAISAAIPIGMALLPFIIIGAIIAAIAILIFNEDIRNKVFAFAGELIGNIGRGLATLGGMLLALFGRAWTAVVGAVGPFVTGIVDWFLSIPGRLVSLGANIVRTIINGLISLPGRIADVVRQAFANLNINIGPFHITGRGVTIDLPRIDTGPATGAAAVHPQGHQAGGWVGLRGPELGLLGEREPEFIIPQSRMGGLGGTVIINIAGQRIAEILLPMISGELYYELQAAAPTGLRT